MDLLNRAWQKLMIRIALSKRLERVVESWPGTEELVQRYVGGTTPAHGVSRASTLQSQNYRSSLFFLGEYVADEAMISNTVTGILELIEHLARNGLDIHISVDPTAIGYLVSPEVCRKNALRIGRFIAERMPEQEGRVDCLMLDMEDGSVVDYTINLHGELQSAGCPAAITLQAYLFRTSRDLKQIAERGGPVRLVKGAFAANRSIAWSTRREIDKEYRRLALVMLQTAAQDPTFYPAFATHDEFIHGYVIQAAERLGLPPSRYEFEMLLGIRPEIAAQLVEQRQTVRIYTPCGDDWWGYVNRRIGESPRNALLLLRTLFLSQRATRNSDSTGQST